MSHPSPENFMVINREPTGANLSFDLWVPGAPRSPGSLKRRTAPVPVNLPYGKKVNLCLLLECSSEDAEEALVTSPQGKKWLDEGFIEAPALQEKVAARKAADPKAQGIVAGRMAAKEAVLGKPKVEAAPAPEPEPEVEEPEEAEPASTDELEGMTKPELLKMAAELDLGVDDRIRKASLIEKIREALEA